MRLSSLSARLAPLWSISESLLLKELLLTGAPSEALLAINACKCLVFAHCLLPFANLHRTFHRATSQHIDDSPITIAARRVRRTFPLATSQHCALTNLNSVNTLQRRLRAPSESEGRQVLYFERCLRGHFLLPFFAVYRLILLCAQQY